MGRMVEFGSLREVVEIIDEPQAGVRIGRIRHANGENVAIDDATLRQLIERARVARGGARSTEWIVFAA